MAGLKPSEEVQVAALVAILVVGIFQLEAPNLADVKASAPGGPASVNTHKSVKTAVWSAAIAVAGISLLTKSPTVYTVGGLLTAAEGWRYYHANAVDAATGAVLAPGAAVNNGQPAPTLNS
jgi:hypothetical protein